jgi:hypothetical protein
MTEEDLIKSTQLEFGSGTVSVELTNDQIKLAIRGTLEVYNRYIPQELRGYFTTQANVSKYLLQERGEGVYDVDWWIGSTFNLDPVLFQPIPGPLLDIVDYVLTQQHLETARDITGSLPDWEELQDPDGKWYLYLTPPPMGTYPMVYWYLGKNSVQTIPSRNEDWFRAMVTAKSKKILGAIRSKWAEIPGVTGGRKLNTLELYTEGVKDEKELLTEIRKRGKKPLPIQR